MDLKRLAVLIFSFVYLGFNGGLSIEAHYCAGKLSSVSVGWGFLAKKCPGCGKEKKPGCCANAGYHLYNPSPQLFSTLVVGCPKVNPPHCILPIHPQMEASLDAQDTHTPCRRFFEPPLGVPVYLRNQVLRV